MIDCFSPTIRSFLSEHKNSIKPKNFDFLLVGFTLFLSSQMFLSGIEMGVDVVCTLLLPGTHDWSFS